MSETNYIMNIVVYSPCSVSPVSLSVVSGSLQWVEFAWTVTPGVTSVWARGRLTALLAQTQGDFV